MSDHDVIQNLWSPSQELSNDISYVGLSQIFITSTCLKSKVWDAVVSPVYVRSNWFSPSVISLSSALQWYITRMIIWKLYNLYIVKVRLIVLKTLHSVISRFHGFSSWGFYRKSLNMSKQRNQQVFELQKIKIYRWKGLENCYSMTIFSKASTETWSSKKPKNPKNNPETWDVNEKVFN